MGWEGKELREEKKGVGSKRKKSRKNLEKKKEKGNWGDRKGRNEK